MIRNFFDFFPTPKFLEMSASGLSFSDGGVRLIEFAYQKNKLLLKKYDFKKLPDGAIVSGKIENREVVVKVLDEIRQKNDLKYVRTTLPEERAYLFKTTIPKGAESNLKTSVEFTIEENVPLSLSEVVFDYTLLSDKKNDVSVSVIPQEVVLEYLSVLKSAGLSPLHFEVESQAIAKAVVKKRDPKTYLVLNLSQKKAGFSIVTNGAVVFSSTVVVSLSNITKPPKTELKYIREDEGQDGNQGSEYLNEELVPIIEEIKKILLYWDGQVEEKGESTQKIESIIICGEEGGRTGVTEYITQNLKMPANLANVWINAFSFDDYIPEISVSDSYGFAGAIGLALPKKVNN